jgi:hypothetical protein
MNDVSRDALVNTRWLHVDGDDAEDGAVFRDADGEIPLSRRPKEILEFSSDGTVRLLASGPDDRAREIGRTAWREEGGHVAFRFNLPDGRGARDYRVIDQGPDRIIVSRQ